MSHLIETNNKVPTIEEQWEAEKAKLIQQEAESKYQPETIVYLTVDEFDKKEKMFFAKPRLAEKYAGDRKYSNKLDELVYFGTWIPKFDVNHTVMPKGSIKLLTGKDWTHVDGILEYSKENQVNIEQKLVAIPGDLFGHKMIMNDNLPAGTVIAVNDSLLDPLNLCTCEGFHKPRNCPVQVD